MTYKPTPRADVTFDELNGPHGREAQKRAQEYAARLMHLLDVVHLDAPRKSLGERMIQGAKEARAWARGEDVPGIRVTIGPSHGQSRPADKIST